MKRKSGKHITIAAAAFAVASIAVLWSWNTLAPLFGGPVAEYKHVLATLVIAGTTRAIVSAHRHRRYPT